MIIATIAASPSIIAVTVIALRPGLRCRLLRAMAPSRGKTSSSGRPTASATGTTIAGATSAIPTRKSTPPSPTSPEPPAVSPNTDTTIRPSPSQARAPTRRW